MVSDEGSTQKEPRNYCQSVACHIYEPRRKGYYINGHAKAAKIEYRKKLFIRTCNMSDKLIDGSGSLYLKPPNWK